MSINLEVAGCLLQCDIPDDKPLLYSENRKLGIRNEDQSPFLPRDSTDLSPGSAFL